MIKGGRSQLAELMAGLVLIKAVEILLVQLLLEPMVVLCLPAKAARTGQKTAELYAYI